MRGFAWVISGAALVPGNANAATIVTDHVVSRTQAAQSNVPVTFGQVFKAGDVPKGQTVVATLNGQPVPLQVDVKATNPDGSLRHAVLTTLVPKMDGRASEPLAIATAPPSPEESPLSLDALLATQYDATASLDIGGKTYSANARALLQAAVASGDCKAWNTKCGVWLYGPLVSEWIVSGPVTASDGTVNTNLVVYFNVRAYAGATPGSIGYVRTDMVVENTKAYAPQAQPQYTATLTSGSASYTSPALTQYAYTRWHQVLWWNGAEPKVYLQQDTQYLQESLAVSKYERLQPDESFLAGLRQSCAPLDHCDQTQDMGATGAQPAIGPLPRWASVYIIDPDPRAYHWMLANTDALGTYSVHFRDEATGWPLSIQQHPHVTLDGWSYANTISQRDDAKAALYRKDLLPTCVNNAVVTGCDRTWFVTGNPYKWDNAHQPAAGYAAYMVTGSHYYMEELAFYASMNELSAGDAYRGFDKGLVGSSRSQIRGKAWVLRQMVNAAWLLPDGYPLKAEFNEDVNNSIADFNAKYTNNPDASPLHIIKADDNDKAVPWQHAFLTWSAGHAAELGFAGATDFRNWLAKADISLMTDWIANPTHGYCWLLASAYTIKVKDASGNWLPNFTAVYAANYPSLVGLACNSPAMVGALAALKDRPWKQGEMYGYPGSATGYPANAQVGLATIADSGLPNAAKAWQIFDSRSIKPQGKMAYDNYPNFAVVPRTIPAAQLDNH